MDISFWVLLNKAVVVYLGDIMVYSKNIDEHLMHLKQIFDHCGKYGISLNPKKSIFVIIEGKFLYFVVSNME
jgi:hypothetical protein